MTKISTQDLQLLDKLLRKKGVYFVDYRTELLDHLLCCVENMDGDVVDNATKYLEENPDFFKPYTNLFAFFSTSINAINPLHKRQKTNTAFVAIGVFGLVYLMQLCLLSFFNYFDIVSTLYGLNSRAFVVFFMYLLYEFFISNHPLSKPILLYYKRMWIINIFLWGTILYGSKVESIWGLLIGAGYASYNILSMVLYFKIRAKELKLITIQSSI